MNIEQKERRNQAYIRAIYDLTMGVLWSGAGIFLLFHEQMGFEFNFDRTLARIFGATCVAYGIFRFYRGFKNRKP